MAVLACASSSTKRLDVHHGAVPLKRINGLPGFATRDIGASTISKAHIKNGCPTMSTHHRSLMNILSITAFILASTAAVDHARSAELRATWDGQHVIRQTSCQQPVATEDDELLGKDVTTLETPNEVLSQATGMDGLGEPQIYAPIPVVTGWTYWGKVEFLLWWRRGKEIPALVTTSSAGTAIEHAGVLGWPTTQVLLGNETVNEAANAGGRVMFGAWLDAPQRLGMGIRFFSLGNNTDRYEAASDTYPILARPFYNLSLSQQDADVVAYPGETIGSIAAESDAKTVGGDAFLRRLFYEDSCHRIDLLVGYQATRIEQDLRISSSRTVTGTGGSIPVGTVVDSYDLFDTENTYHAVAIGFIGEYDRGPMTWRLLAKVGLGRMRQQVHIDGRTTTMVPGQGTTTTNQGLLAQDSNIGNYERKVFSASPELALSVAYHITESLDLTAGYSFVYWNHVMQPMDQVDTRVDVRNHAAPRFSTEDSDYFLQGLNFGIQFAF